MSLLASTDDAEQVARTWMEKRYGKGMGKVKFIEVTNENGVWAVKATVKLASGFFEVKPHLVLLKIDSNSMNIVGYSDTELSGNQT
jgi:hypothetical protein